METYFDVDRVSHSSLSALERMFAGQSPELNVNPDILQFGSDFHCAVLEHHKYNKLLSSHAYYVEHMKESVEKNLLFSKIKSSPSVLFEHERYFTCPFTKIKCKSKYDIWDKEISMKADLKSTSARSRSAFIDSLSEYNYFRQASFYMMPDNTKTFHFIGVQKKHPFSTFTYSIDINHKKIVKGFEEYTYLLRKGIKLGYIKC